MSSTQPQVELRLTEKNEVERVHRGRASAIARLEGTTLIWKDELCQSGFRKSTLAFLFEEKITVKDELLEGQKLDVVPAKAPPPPAQHAMQGEMTPAYLDWLVKWMPVKFQNLLGVVLVPKKDGEEEPKDPRDRWMRADCIRTDTRPTEESKGGQYISTRFIKRDQIIARRPSHLTFTAKEIYRGKDEAKQAEPYADPYVDLAALDKKGEIEIVSVKNSAASAGSAY
jgi:hypothetical protein